jgi:hypothetical protein
MRPSSRPPAPDGGPPVSATCPSVFALGEPDIGAGLLAYLAESRIIDLHALRGLFTPWPITLAVVARLLIDTTLTALRLSCLFRPHRLDVRLAIVRWTLVGLFFSTFFPGGTGGGPGKHFYAAKEEACRCNGSGNLGVESGRAFDQNVPRYPDGLHEFRWPVPVANRAWAFVGIIERPGHRTVTNARKGSRISGGRSVRDGLSGPDCSRGKDAENQPKFAPSRG